MSLSIKENLRDDIIIFKFEIVSIHPPHTSGRSINLTFNLEIYSSN